MKIHPPFVFFILVLFCLSGVAFSQTGKKTAEFLEGVWQRDGKEVFESWEKSGENLLKGRGYRVRDGKEQTTETLEIKQIDGVLYYLATVPDQNDGATISFRLTNSSASSLVFENPAHDFPKRIAYKKLSESQIFVEVTGAGGKGFSFRMTKRTRAALTREFISAFNDRKLEKMMSFLDPDVKWMTVYGDQMRTVTANREELRIFLEGYFKSCPTCRSEIKNVSETGSRVTLTESVNWQTPAGTKTQSSLGVYEFAGGRIVRVYYYADSPLAGYDERLGKKLGADERGMKTFVLVWLKTGPAKLEKEERAKLIKGHMESIGRLADAGKLVLAGPFMENDSLRGLYVFDVRTKEEAAELVQTDPAVKAGVFDVELRLWYGSAALLELNGIHKMLQKPTDSK